MTKKIKRFIFPTIVLVLLTLFIYSYYSYSMVRVTNRHVELFSSQLKSIVNEQDVFDMTDVTDFDWDKMIVFGPYTSREEMEKKVGQKWTTYSFIGYYAFQKTIFGKYPLDDDSYNKVIFIKDDKIVLDATFNRGQVDFTLLDQVITREEARFHVEGKKLIQSSE